MTDKIAVAKTFDIPATLEEAAKMASLLGELAFAATWKRSAIVRAYVTKGKGGPRTGKNSYQLSVRQFAELGIVGLSSRPTVQRYYDAWELTGLPDPKPGEFTELPPLPPEGPEFPAVTAAKDAAFRDEVAAHVLNPNSDDAKQALDGPESDVEATEDPWPTDHTRDDDDPSETGTETVIEPTAIIAPAKPDQVGHPASPGAEPGQLDGVNIYENPPTLKSTPKKDKPAKTRKPETPTSVGDALKLMTRTAEQVRAWLDAEEYGGLDKPVVSAYLAETGKLTQKLEELLDFDA